MNLRDLLLQFAGENERSLNLSELLYSNIDEIEDQKVLNSGVELYLNECVSEDIINTIDNLLLKEGYDTYDIIKINDNILKVEINWSY